MDDIRHLLKIAAGHYNKSVSHYEACITLIEATRAKLIMESQYEAYGRFAGKPPVDYHVFCSQGVASRPVRPDIYLADQDEFSESLKRLSDGLSSRPQDLTDDDSVLANRVVYTAVMSVACCYDLWQRGSRKTPGTFFEIFMAALLQRMLPAALFTKHIPLAGLSDGSETAVGLPGDLESVEAEEEEGGPSSVSTDLVIGMKGRAGGVVIPLKITSRERIVQPFAHQRILDSAFGVGVYHSLLVCISETQLDDRTKSVKQVCVPGTVKLFQKYLAPIGGLYYCDIPQRYFQKDMQNIVPVRSVGDFFKDIARILESHRKS